MSDKFIKQTVRVSGKPYTVIKKVRLKHKTYTYKIINKNADDKA